MTHPEPSITVKVDLTNPGQFFACCGLLELADRLWPGAEGWFIDHEFNIACCGELKELMERITDADLLQLDPEDDMASPIQLCQPFNLTLNWWTDKFTGGWLLKVWAGSMRGVRIARAMQQAIRNTQERRQLLDFATVVYDPDNPKKKVEPFYFDSRRGRNAQSRDIGFAPDSLNMTSAAYPAVEFLCLVGLQRCRPAQTKKRRVFDYFKWTEPLPVQVAAAAANGSFSTANSSAYRFENAFRTDQKKHKAFLPATLIGDSL